MTLLNYLETINVHPETYLDIHLDKCIYDNYNVPTELNKCLCCFKHTDIIMAFNKKNCKCPCRHFKRLINEKIKMNENE